MKTLISGLVFFTLWIMTIPLYAQHANNPLLYSYQAVQFSDQQISHDPVTLVMPGTAYASGFGSFLDNPASAALFENSFGSFGMAFRDNREESSFLGNRVQSDNGQIALSNLGFLYHLPTSRGKMVMGAGYSQHSFYNRALEISGRNTETTITDEFKMPWSDYREIGFSTYATDYGDEFEDWDESIFRVGFDQYGHYLGIHQEGEILQHGFGGEFSGFFATEFQRNLMVGISVGIKSGRSAYDRTFLEIDRDGDYNSEFIDTNEDGEGNTDIDRILLVDEVSSEFLALQVRGGAIYRLNDHLNIGASYTLPARMTVDETFDARVATTFDNGVSFEDDVRGEFTYRVHSPHRIGVGLSLTDIGGWTASLGAEYADYGKTAVEFDSDNFEAERLENDFISDTYTDVWNLRAGLAYDLGGSVTLRGGYAHYPSRFRNLDLDKNHYSAGAGFKLNQNTRLEIAAQYTTWKEDAVVYNYGAYDYSSLPDAAPVISEQSELSLTDVARLQLMATLRFSLY
ncbi:MAG: outer membrane protein transport protein [Balneolaceae bacterium]